MDFSSIRSMKKHTSSTSHKQRIHPSFPEQGTVQPSHAGSQSNTPDINMQNTGPQGPGNIPADLSTAMTAQGQY